MVKKGAKQSEELKTIRENSLEVKRMLDDMGLDTSDIDFDIMQAGDKKVVKAVFTDGIPCTVTFYKTKNRGDRRLSISGIKRRAQIGDLLAFDFVKTGERDPMMVINVTARIERRKINDCG